MCFDSAMSMIGLILHSLIAVKIKRRIKFILKSARLTLKGHGQLCGRADLDPSFLTLKKVHLNPKSKIRFEYISKSASIFPVSYSIFHPLLKTCF